MNELKELWFYLKEIRRLRQATKAYERMMKDDDMEFRMLVSALETVVHRDKFGIDLDPEGTHRQYVETRLKQVTLPVNRWLARYRQTLLRRMGYSLTIEDKASRSTCTVLVEANGIQVLSRT